MVWFQVCDTFWSHPKVLDLPADAGWLWVRSGSYCAQHLTDGMVTNAALRMLGGDQSTAAVLVFAGLWKSVRGGYRFHDWDVYQQDRNEVLSKRASEAERKRKYREGKRKSGANVPMGQPTGQDAGQYAGRDKSNPNQAKPKKSTKDMLTQSASEFDQFWSAYPRKIGKRKAQAAYRSAIKRTNAEAIITAACQLRDDPNLPDKQFIPHPATWLNRDGWHDDPYPDRTDTRGPSGSEIFATLDPQLVDHAAATLNGHSTRKAINA